MTLFENSRFLPKVEDPWRQAKLAQMLVETEQSLNHKPYQRILDLLSQLPDYPDAVWQPDRDWVTIGPVLEPEHPVRKAIQAAAEAIRPWKKGPYNLFGVEIDAEWRSDYKWQRFANELPNLKGADVLDVGGNNGYYSFRVLEQDPDYVLCIDPIARLWYQFQLMQRYARDPRLEFQMWGWQALDLMPESFDCILCMGILYHHTDPVQLCRNLFAALRPGGFLVMETIVIPGTEQVCLFPPDRYAMMRNVWFVPTVAATCSMLERTRFRDVEVIHTAVHEPAEQRSTLWNPAPSFEDFLDPKDREKTIEGLPAPHRAIVFAHKH
jgi:tRNA (mo5U34)-methyltransferase